MDEFQRNELNRTSKIRKLNRYSWRNRTLRRRLILKAKSFVSWGIGKWESLKFGIITCRKWIDRFRAELSLRINLRVGKGGLAIRKRLKWEIINSLKLSKWSV